MDPPLPRHDSTCWIPASQTPLARKLPVELDVVRRDKNSNDSDKTNHHRPLSIHHHSNGYERSVDCQHQPDPDPDTIPKKGPHLIRTVNYFHGLTIIFNFWENAKLSYPDQVLSVRGTQFHGANVGAKVTRGF